MGIRWNNPAWSFEAEYWLSRVEFGNNLIAVAEKDLLPR